MSEGKKSLKTIRNLRKKQPKLVQPAKKTLIVRGNKTSDKVMSFLKDIRSLRRQRSTMYSRKHDTYPFEDPSIIESYAKNADASLFLFGSHSKKRPNNIILGRTFQHKTLDIVQLGINNIKSIQEIVQSVNIPNMCRPFVMFQGDVWETDDVFKKLRNLFNDFFFQNNKIEQGIQIDQMLKVLIVFTALENKTIVMKVYQVAIQGGEKILEQQGKLVIQQLGPNVQFSLRRHRFADPDVFKKATYVPKPKKKKEKKNLIRDAMGNQRRKLYVDRQDLNVIPTKKRKLIVKQNGKKVIREKLTEEKNENQFGN